MESLPNEHFCSLPHARSDGVVGLVDRRFVLVLQAGEVVIPIEKYVAKALSVGSKCVGVWWV